MNPAVRFCAFLSLVSMKADGFKSQPLTTPSKSNSTQHQLHRNESESNAAATDFLDELVAAILNNYPTDGLSKFAPLTDPQLAASNESALHSNWSSTLDYNDVLSSGASQDEDEEVGGVDKDTTTYPEVSSMSADMSASLALENVTGSASGGLKNTIGDDANMRDGENSAVVRLLSGIIVPIMVLHAFTLAL